MTCLPKTKSTAMHKINIDFASYGTAILLGIFAGGCEKSPEKDIRKPEKPNIIYILKKIDNEFI